MIICRMLDSKPELVLQMSCFLIYIIFNHTSKYFAKIFDIIGSTLCLYHCISLLEDYNEGIKSIEQGSNCNRSIAFNTNVMRFKHISGNFFQNFSSYKFISRNFLVTRYIYDFFSLDNYLQIPISDFFVLVEQ